jgi:predicted deacetylase
VTRQLCIVLHDVAPATWPQCTRLLAWLDSFCAGPVTLLVVPDFHRKGRIDRDADFKRAIELRLRRGDELALHGYEHCDRSPSPLHPSSWIRRRVLTAGEGEFAALRESQARDKLQQGLDMFARLGWPVAGFVPPAWLASAGTRVALRDSGLHYSSTHTALIDLPRRRRLFAPCITASSRSAWRRAASRTWLRVGAETFAPAPLIRVGLHPADASHADLMQCWANVLDRLLQQREAVTKSSALFTLTRTIRHHA